jgi:hypothetical protein
MNARPVFPLPLTRVLWLITVLGAACGILFCPGQALAVEPWPDMPIPPNVDAQWIAQSMRVNGVPTRIMQFQARQSRRQIVEYYTNRWSSGYARKPSVRPLGDATVINQGQGPYLMTVKVEDDVGGNSHGLISVARVLGSRPDTSPGLVELMPGGRVLQVVESDDLGKHSRQVLILTPQSTASVSEFYQAAFTNNGWRQLQGADASQPEEARRGSFMVFSQAGAEMQMSIVASRSRLGGSTVLTNLVTKGTGPDGD